MRAAVALAIVLAAPAAGDDLVTHQVVPSEADPGVRQFDVPSVALARRGLSPEAPLAIFLPGSNGRPGATPELLATIAGQGYRVLALEYDDSPSVSQVCPQDPDPACAEKFRAMRTFGAAEFTQITNPPAEAIVPRLVAALKALEKAAPREGWAGYLTGDTPRWDRIVVSGLSQGAGMAALIAKRYTVRRVVLFSSPWDVTGMPKHPAPWLGAPSATPPERWFAEYHAREKTVPLIKAAYRALAIPADHIAVFDLDLPAGAKADGANPFHPSTVRNPGYAAQWRVLYGSAG